MKKSYVVIGILILIIGGILFVVGYKTIEVADEAISEYETLLGQLARLLPEQERHYQDALQARETGQTLEIAGGMIGVVGMGVIVWGYMKVEEERSQQQVVVIQQPTSQESRYCKSCGREISVDYVVCPYCGVER